MVKFNVTLDDEEFMFYVQMITKKYKLGVDAKTVNKCIPNLIPTWEVQLGSSYDKLKLNSCVIMSTLLNISSVYVYSA